MNVGCLWNCPLTSKAFSGLIDLLFHLIVMMRSLGAGNEAGKGTGENIFSSFTRVLRLSRSPRALKNALWFALNILGPFYSTSNFSCSRDEGEKWLLPKCSFLRMRFFSLLSR